MQGAGLMLQTVKKIEQGNIALTEQNKLLANQQAKHAPKIFKDDTRIDWNKHVHTVYNLIRGMSPYPGAYTMMGDKQIKIYKAHFSHEEHGKDVGIFETDGKTYLRFATIDGWLYADELQQESKKRMDVTAFLRGFRAN